MGGRTHAPLPPAEVADTIHTLYDWGVQNVAYYPDNLYRNNPDPALLRPVFDSKPNRAPPAVASRPAAR